jgi:fatty acid desaturase
MKPLVKPAILKQLSQTAMLPWVLRVIFDWLQIAFAFFLILKFPHPVTYLFSWMLLGIKMNSLEILMHDAAHFTLSRNRQLNDFLGYTLVSIPLGASLSGYRKFHLEHHRHQGTERDPEIHYQSARPRWARPLNPARLRYLFLTDLIGFGLVDIMHGLKGIRPQKKFEPILNGIFLASVLYLSWKMNALVIVPFWLLAGATSHWALFRLRTFTEHAGVDLTPRFKASPFYRYILFPHNTHMHHEHHAFPTVPLWNLPKLRENLVSVEIQSESQLFDGLNQIKSFPW